MGISISNGVLRDISLYFLIQNQSSLILTSKLFAVHQTLSMFLRKIYYLDHDSFTPRLIIIIQRLIIENKHWSNKESGSIKYVKISDNTKKSQVLFNSYIKNMEQGSPTSSESDACLSELLSSDRCYVSTFCQNIMDENRISKGYHLTHKLLYYIIIRNRGCMNVFEKTFTTLTRHFCQEIHKEIYSYMTKPLDFRLRDIFLEQVLLCAYLGFSEFFIKDWVEIILEWQDPDGQFRHLGYEFDSHINGLAVAFLTILGKILLL